MARRRTPRSRAGSSAGSAPSSALARAARHITERAVPLGEPGIALGRETVPAAPRSADEDAIAGGEDVLAAVVDAAAVDAHVAEAAGATAREPRRGELRALRHEAHRDRARRLALEQDLLTEPAPEPPGAPRPGTQPLVVD